MVDVHLFQVPTSPALQIDVDRVLARQIDMTQGDVASNVLVALSSSAVVSPNFWINPRNQVSYQLVVQTPQYQVNSVADLQRLPLTGGRRGDQMLMNVADVSRDAGADGPFRSQHPARLRRQRRRPGARPGRRGGGH